MPSAGSDSFRIELAASPLAVLPSRLMSVRFPLPSPLLRALGPGERPDDGLWSDRLAGWGWTWRLPRDGFAPDEAMLVPWFFRSEWPAGFNPRVLALAVALKLRVDGRAIGAEASLTDIGRAWRTIASIPENLLAEALALALIRADAAIFDFGSTAPQWPHEAATVMAEREPLRGMRAPTPVWLRTGYQLLGEDGFGQLRSLATSLSECELIHTELESRTGPLPLAFEMAYWWEAVYCLTERHNYGDAELAEERLQHHARALGQITGLIDPLWHHQQGRLMYYAGNFSGALAAYVREYEALGGNLNVKAMLEREISNVLSDLACLDGARCFAQRSIDSARAQGQLNELYKSLGRMAEIEIKQDRLVSAEALLQESLSIQRALKVQNTAQTQTYLGHAALLSGRHDIAEERYLAALECGADSGSAPYIAMGRMSLALATGNAVELERLWVLHRQTILNEWMAHPTHVLPGAVCIVAAAAGIDSARSHLAAAVRSLIDRSYAVEAAFAMQSLPEETREPIAASAVQLLRGWQKTLNSLPPAIREIAANPNGPGKVADAVRAKRIKNEAWIRSAAYPANLVPVSVH